MIAVNMFANDVLIIAGTIQLLRIAVVWFIHPYRAILRVVNVYGFSGNAQVIHFVFTPWSEFLGSNVPPADVRVACDCFDLAGYLLADFLFANRFRFVRFLGVEIHLHADVVGIEESRSGGFFQCWLLVAVAGSGNGVSKPFFSGRDTGVAHEWKYIALGIN